MIGLSLRVVSSVILPHISLMTTQTNISLSKLPHYLSVEIINLVLIIKFKRLSGINQHAIKHSIRQ